MEELAHNRVPETTTSTKYTAKSNDRLTTHGPVEVALKWV